MKIFKRIILGIMAFLFILFGIVGFYIDTGFIFSLFFIAIGGLFIYLMFKNPFVEIDKNHQKEHIEKILQIEDEFNTKHQGLKNEYAKKSLLLKNEYQENKLKLSEEKDLLEVQLIKLQNDIKEKQTELEHITTKKIDEKNKNLESINIEIINLTKTKTNLEKELDDLSKKQLYEVIDYFDSSKFSSSELKNKLSILQLEEKELVQKNDAFKHDDFDSKREQNTKSNQIFRSFNAETEQAINNVTARNMRTNRNKVLKSFESLNKLYIEDGVQLSKELLENKLQQLTLVHEYKVKLEQEKEQQRYIREQLAEEESVRQEIEREKIKIEKEEAQFNNEVQKLLISLKTTENDAEKQLYIDKIQELENKLKKLSEDKDNVLKREINTRAGFVYIISNIGSFGENIYKIGMTRRLDPMDRVRELSTASVPFKFDVHAMIFSEDAPKLETILHNAFSGKEVNKINTRKEFFNINLKEIEKVVKENFNPTVDFTYIPEAEEYRETLRIEENS